MNARRPRARRTLGAIIALTLLVAVAAPVAAAAPSNDDIAAATAIPGLPYADGPVDTTEATIGATDPGFCHEPDAGPDRATVWYSLTAPATERLAADTLGSDYDTTLYVGTPDGSGGIDLIGCIDDSVGLQSVVIWDAEAGTTYLIMVGTCCGSGDGTGGGGSLQLHVGLAPPPPTIDLVLSPTGKFSRAGVATIGGTIACTGLDFASVEALITQRVGRIELRGYGSNELACGPEPTAFSIDLSSPYGRFAGGLASVQLFAFGCGLSECVGAEASGQVRLAR